MNQQLILDCLGATLQPKSPQDLKNAESQLIEIEKTEGFTLFLLEIATSQETALNLRTAASIYLKNRIRRGWLSTGQYALSDAEKQQLKQNLVQGIVQNADSNSVRPQLSECIRRILTTGEEWDLPQVIYQLLTSGKEYAGLLLLFELAHSTRFEFGEKRQRVDQYCEQLLPVVENLVMSLIPLEDFHSSEMIYLILKIFKYTMLMQYPRYLQSEKLDAWIKLHLYLVEKPLPKAVYDLDPADRSLDKRVKVNKWGYGNLYKLLYKFGTTSKNIPAEFTSMVQQYVPQILQVYFKMIESWGQGSIWLSDSSLFYLISFLESCMTSDCWTLIQPHLEIIVKHLIFPCVKPDEQQVELYEEDPEEYIRRYFDVNKEGSTADVASTDFVFVIGHKRPECLSMLLSFLSENFNSFNNTVESACAIEGSLRLLGSISHFLERDESIQNQMDSVVQNFIAPYLAGNYPFLTARACEALSMFNFQYTKGDVLSDVVTKIVTLFFQSSDLAIQVQAASALKTLVICNDIKQQLSSHVPAVMESLLSLSKEVESDVLPEIMEAFVEQFSQELLPFAATLGSNLSQQFIAVATELLSTDDVDKEYQAAGLLNTMSTMTMSMSENLQPIFMPVVRFIIDNALLSFLTEANELLCALSANNITQVVWETLDEILYSFSTYGLDFFEVYQQFFELIIMEGFTKDTSRCEKFLTVISEALNHSEIELEVAMDIMSIYALAIKEIPLTLACYQAYNDGCSDDKLVRLILSSIIVKPVETLQLIDFNQFMTLWSEMTTVSIFNLKLQILAILSLLKVEIPLQNLGQHLMLLLQQLPAAQQKRDALMGAGAQDFDDSGEDWLDEDDDFRETPLDNVDVMAVVKSSLSNLQQQQPQRFQDLLQVLSQEQVTLLQQI